MSDEPEVPSGPARRSKGQGVGQTIGGILVGFDEQVWRRQPPAQERVVAVDRLHTVVARSGLAIDLPDDTLVGGTPDGPGEAPEDPEPGPG